MTILNYLLLGLFTIGVSSVVAFLMFCPKRTALDRYDEFKELIHENEKLLQELREIEKNLSEI